MKKFEIGGLLIRLTLGIIFFAHGLAKFQGGIENIAGWFSSIGLPGSFAYVVAIIELIGGILLILGFGTRIVSVLIALLMIGAIFKGKLAAGLLGNAQGAGYELDLALLAMALYLVISGNGVLSLEKVFKKEEQY
jgi:putative oxidoreductase